MLYINNSTSSKTSLNSWVSSKLNRHRKHYATLHALLSAVKLCIPIFSRAPSRLIFPSIWNARHALTICYCRFCLCMTLSRSQMPYLPSKVRLRSVLGLHARSGPRVPKPPPTIVRPRPSLSPRLLLSCLPLPFGPIPFGMPTGLVESETAEDEDSEESVLLLLPRRLVRGGRAEVPGEIGTSCGIACCAS